MTRDALEEGPPDDQGRPTYPNLDMAFQPTGTRGTSIASGRPVLDAGGNPVLLDVEATTPDGRTVSQAAADQAEPT